MGIDPVTLRRGLALCHSGIDPVVLLLIDASAQLVVDMVWPHAQGGRILPYSRCVALFVEGCSAGIDPVTLRRGLALCCNRTERDEPAVDYAGMALPESMGCSGYIALKI